MPERPTTQSSRAKLASAFAEMRRRAQAKLEERSAELDQPRNEADTQRLVHELQVHQIQLEMQNEELVRAREASEAALEKYGDLYDFAPVGFVTLDREGTILESNFSLAGLLGVDRSQLISRPFAQRIPPAERGAFARFLDQIAACRTRASCEATLVKEDRSTVPVRIEATMAAEGDECRLAVTDLTEHNRAERDRLVLSKLESTGILAGGIAHDFNNLLAVILLNLEQARLAGGKPGEIAGFLEDCRTAVLAARGLTHQLITFARGGAPARQLVSLSGIIPEAVRPAVSGSPVRCEISADKKLWATEIDPDQIGQVLRQVVLNAREAMPDGGVVSIRAENVVLETPGPSGLSPGNYVRVSVTDRGTGIAPGVLPKIFDPYFSTKQRGAEKGMGMGLSICHSVVTKHGGSIHVQSEVGVGTTVSMHLPASPDRTVIATVPAPAARIRRGAILLMDDEEPLRRMLGATLRRMGHEVETVSDGRRAIEAYRRAKDLGQPFDLVFLDLTVRDGLGATATMRELRTLDPAVSAVIMTGYANDPTVLDPASEGFKGVLVKPFDISKLQELVSCLLDAVDSAGGSELRPADGNQKSVTPARPTPPAS